ncbi:glycosyltransferase family 2 protein [Leucobacter aridicollis]|uniref:Glycosyltransferase 2-like domain-containing protein n=1 Tax=Leucobacter aridicollis TaxID=283878 RepID=A0A852R4Q6_9MICO|nr:glycosyltransferase family 2 protein [Leucobacter aridicollis]MBL3683216.1 glycosyltransferase family 2 protein [Leucobacter aridicollis]NYD25449.1 hypothetical protein [Leucobacter aridicollis]
MHRFDSMAGLPTALLQAAGNRCLTVVITMFNVERYLEDLLESLDRQADIRAGYIPIVLVDDGSTDRTISIARSWEQRTKFPVTILEQENSGPGAARNAGLDVCETPWVTFVDGDDVLSDCYLSEILDEVESARQSPELLVTNIIRFLEGSRELKNDHPLRYKFRDGTRTVRLEHAPHFFQLSSSTAVFRMEPIRASGLRFDVELMVFEDAKFIGEYLLLFSSPSVRVLHRAQYLYRRRGDASSLVPSAERSTARYLDVPERAYLPLIEISKAGLGRVPAWLQAMIVYDLYWTAKLDIGMDGPARTQSPTVRKKFLELLRQVLTDISVEQIEFARAQYLPSNIRSFFLALKGELDVPSTVLIDRLDPSRSLLRARYSYPVGQEPGEEFTWGGELIEPTFGKRRAVCFFDEMVYMERIVWLPAAREISARINGDRVTFVRGELQEPLPVMHEWVSWSYFVPKWERPSVVEGNHDVGPNLLSDRKVSLRYP